MNQSWTKVLPKFVRTKIDGRINVLKIITNIGWLFVDRILRLGIGVFISVWVARYLGPEQFGLWSYAIAFVSLFSTLATLGLDSIVVRDLVRNPSGKEEILGTAFILRLMGGIITLLLSISSILFIHSNTETYWLVGILSFGTIFLAFDTIDFWFQSQVKSKYIVYAKNAAFIVASALKITLILLHMPLIWFVLAGLLELFLGTLGMIIVYQHNHEKLWSWRFSYIRAKELLQSSWLLILSGLVIMIYMRIDQIMLGQILGEKSVGIYSAAVKLSEAWYFLPIAIVSSIFPSIVESKNKDEGLYMQRMQKLLSIMVIMAFIIAIPITFLSKFIITFLYGKRFVEASSSLIILAWTSLFVFLGIARESWMVTEGLMKFSFATTALGALSNIVFNFILIPTHGPAGAALATLISQFIAVSLSTLIFSETRVMFKMQINSILLYKYKEIK